MCQILYTFCTPALKAQILQNEARNRRTVEEVPNEASLLHEQSIALIVRTLCYSGVRITGEMYCTLVTCLTVRAVTEIHCSYWRTFFFVLRSLRT
uniref:Uncharacterized protein n=1 Tax=Rhipicephalus zambeziensis TaxID=60191 RepID=A0A224Y563_9ACAR